MSQTHFQPKPPDHRWLAGYFLVNALEGAGVFWLLVTIPPDPKNNLILGFSLQRLILLGVVLILSAIFIVLSIASWQSKEIITNPAVKILSSVRSTAYILIGSGILLGFAWVLCWTPAIRFGDYAAYFTRFFPFLLWLMLVSGQTFFPLLVRQQGIHWSSLPGEKTSWKTYRPVLMIAGLFFLVWILISLTKFGIDPTDKIFGWGRPGTPILTIQVMLAAAVGLGFMLWELSWSRKRPVPSKKRDLVICLVIWLLTIVIWISLPYLPSYFVPKPLPPNFNHTPYSDGLYYDSTAQSILVGQGYGYHQDVSRPLYILFLAFLHAIAGQNYDTVILIQTLFLALFPVVLYLIGKNLHSRGLGLILAILAVAKEWNAVQTTPWLEVSDSKMLLTDLPTALMIGIFCLAVIYLLKKPGELQRSVIAGGILGLALLLRLNTIIFLPLTWIMLGWANRWIFSKTIKPAAIFSLATLIVIFPWMWRNKVVTGTFGMENLKLQRIILDRYLLTPDGIISSNTNLAGSQSGSTATPSQITSTVQPAGSPTTSTAIIPTEFSPGNIVPTPAGPIPSSPLLSNNVFEQAIQLIRTRGSNLLWITGNQFMHNEVESILILPVTLVNVDLNMLIHENEFFTQDWSGQISLPAGLMIFINILLISLGIGLAWNKAGLTGLFLLWIHLTYNLTNGLARISGWRFLLPVDWIVYFYYALGLLQVVIWVFTFFGIDLSSIVSRSKDQEHPASGSKPATWQTIGLIVLLLGFGIAIVLPEWIIQPQYPNRTNQQVISLLVTQEGFTESGISPEQVKTFMKLPGAIAVYQRALYPRFYLANKGEAEVAEAWYSPRKYPRLGVTLTGQIYFGAILPMEKPPEFFPHPSDVIVVGCKDGNAIDAYLIAILASPTRFYVRSPITTLTCPLASP